MKVREKVEAVKKRLPKSKFTRKWLHTLLSDEEQFKGWLKKQDKARAFTSYKPAPAHCPIATYIKHNVDEMFGEEWEYAVLPHYISIRHKVGLNPKRVRIDANPRSTTAPRVPEWVTTFIAKYDEWEADLKRRKWLRNYYKS